MPRVRMGSRCLPIGTDRFMNNWSTNQDPRAYAVDKMTPTDRAQLVTSMGGVNSDAYQKFKNSLRQAVSTGVVTVPGATNTAAGQ